MHDDQPYRIFLAILFVAGMSMSFVFRSRAARAGGRMEGRPEGLAMALALRVPALVGILTIIAFMVHPQRMAWSQVDLPPWVRWAGGAIAAVGHVPSKHRELPSLLSSRSIVDGHGVDVWRQTSIGRAP